MDESKTCMEGSKSGMKVKRKFGGFATEEQCENTSISDIFTSGTFL